jgi:hypothetical protein
LLHFTFQNINAQKKIENGLSLGGGPDVRPQHGLGVQHPAQVLQARQVSLDDTSPPSAPCWRKYVRGRKGCGNARKKQGRGMEEENWKIKKVK